MKRKSIFVPTQQMEPLFQTARSTAVCHILGILMPSRNQIQTDPAAEHTHDCLLGRRERVTVRAGLAIWRLPQEQPCWLFGLDLQYRVVTIRQVLNTGDAHRACQHVCPAGSPGTADGFAGVRSCDATVLWCTFFWHCMMHHAVLGCCTKLCSSPHPAYFLCHRSPASRGYAKLTRDRFFFNFYASSLPKLPTL